MSSKKVLITGAGSGIGRCFAQALASEGAELILLDVDEGGLRETAALLAARGSQHVAKRADVSDRVGLERAVAESLQPIGRLDLLINCAAILGGGPWCEQTAQDFERVVQVDLLGTVNCIRASLPWLRAARGHIVNMASTAAVHGWPGLAAYSAAKFGIVGYSEGIRAELAAQGIGLTVVFPLLIDTPLLSRPGTPPILRRGRRIPPDVVVRKVLWAVSRRKSRVYIPATVRIISALHGLAPSLLDWYGKQFGLE
jgi:NAD(P)-dependent dehydrogenase (short-subunit alcohol dehydrogenase family)